MTSRAQRGFTMIELMVTVAVLAVLTAIALPNFRDFMRRNAVTSHTNEMLGDLLYARQTATTEMSIVSLCASASPASSSPTCSGDGNYAQGWIIYKAPAAGDAFAAGTGFELLRVTQPINNVSIQSDSNAPISFNQRGAAPGGEVQLKVCARSSGDTVGASIPAVPGVQIKVIGSGRPATTKLATDADDAAAQALCQ
jgi:type IV fimbrial biogenesis protein FimT